MALSNFHRYSPTKGGWKLPAGTSLRFKKGQGYYTVPRAAGPVKVQVDPITQQVEAAGSKMFNEQQAALTATADKLRQEAAQRASALQNAYGVASRMNAEMGGQIQSGWNNAAGNIQGLAGAGSGQIADALRADVATQDAALARVGAPGVGLDPGTQQGVENYRGGSIPAGTFSTFGGIGNEFAVRNAQNLNNRGVQEGQAAAAQSNVKIDQTLLDQVAALTKQKFEYQQAYRGDLVKAQSDALERAQKARFDLIDARQNQQKLDQDYKIAQANALTSAEKVANKKAYDDAMLIYKQDESAALTAQRQASAALSGIKAQDILDNPGTGGGSEGSSPTTISNNVKRADTAGKNAIQLIKDNIWKQTPGSSRPAEWDEKIKGPYDASPAYKAALDQFNRQKTASFKTAISRVTRAISPHLKSLGWKQARINAKAYEMLSAAGWTPPKGYKVPTFKGG